ncbi:unnamed protein product [Spodoptera exigua]|nr:unnamed protein product [Spodoptera exigua]
MLASSYQSHSIVKVPLAVAVPYGGYLTFLLLRYKRIRLGELVLRLVGTILQYLLAEVVVDECSFEREVTRRVDGVAIVSWRLYRCLVNSQQVKFRVITLVEEQLVTNLLNDDIPGVVGPGAAHNGGQDGVGGVHRAHSLTEPSDYRVVSSSHRMEDTIDTLQRLLMFHIDTIIAFVIVLQCTTAHNVFTFFNSWQRQFRKTWEVHVFNGDPSWSYSDRRITDLHRSTSLAPPLAKFTIPLISHVVVALVEGSHATWRARAPGSAASLTASTTTLVWGLLHPRSVHQVESTLIFIMEVRV